MRYDFETLAERIGVGSLKTERMPEIIRKAGFAPFCYAEMDFKTSPVIIDAIVQKAKSGYYGYTIHDKKYSDAIVSWMHTRRKWDIQPEWIVPTRGTIASINTCIRAFSEPGDGVIIQPPVHQSYNESIQANGRHTVNNPLIYKNGYYSMDFEQLRNLASQPRNKLLLLCNPQNPGGRVWTEQELITLAKIAYENNLIVLSDEIFAETTFKPNFTTCFASVDMARDNSIICTSLGKAFNFTGFNHANIIIPSSPLRESFTRQRDIDHYGSMDPFLYPAVIAAYEDGGEWLDAMIEYVSQNLEVVTVFLSEHLPQITLVKPEGTFLIWIDWHGLGMDEDELYSFLVEEASFMVERGSIFGAEGTCFSRMNLALPLAEVEKGLQRLLYAARSHGFAK